MMYSIIQTGAAHGMQTMEQNARQLMAQGMVTREEVDKKIEIEAQQFSFVSRCFYPEAGIEEDPVTGSAHTMLTPYWANQLSKDELEAHQLSKRGGKLICRLENDRVYISGSSVIYFEGTISIV